SVGGLLIRVTFRALSFLGADWAAVGAARTAIRLRARAAHDSRSPVVGLIVAPPVRGVVGSAGRRRSWGGRGPLRPPRAVDRRRSWDGRGLCRPRGGVNGPVPARPDRDTQGLTPVRGGW